jgi:2-iminobutanoate/2-iminopropanoate deaminase
LSQLEVVRTDHAPTAIGPYSQAIVVDGWVYCSGQIALDPTTMEVTATTIADQTDRVLQNLAAVLAAAGASLSRVVKTTVFLSDMADFTAMNEVYGRHFGEHRPARATVQAAGLPRGVKVEIECVARAG